MPGLGKDEQAQHPRAVSVSGAGRGAGERRTELRQDFALVKGWAFVQWSKEVGILASSFSLSLTC